MRIGVFLCRVALICNCCYVLSVVGRMINLSELNRHLVGTVAVLGLLFGIFLNIGVNVYWFVVLARKKSQVPFWLGITNFILLVVQILNSFIFQL